MPRRPKSSFVPVNKVHTLKPDRDLMIRLLTSEWWTAAQTTNHQP